MRGRRTDNRGGRGRGRSARDLSPSPRMKNHRTSWDQSHLHHHRSSNRSRSPAATRERAWRSPGRRSSSVDIREYSHVQNRRADHGKQRLRSPNPRSQFSPFDHKRYEIPPDYMLPDHPSGLNLPEDHAGLKPFRVVLDRDYLHPGSGRRISPDSPTVGMQNMSVHRPVHSDCGAAREIYTLPNDSSYVMNTKTWSDFSFLNDGIRNYTNHVMDPYERDRVNQYSKELSYARMVAPAPIRPPDGASSASFPRDGSLGLYDGLHPHLSEKFVKSGLSKFSEDLLDRDRYTQVQLSDPVKRAHFNLVYHNEPQDYSHHELSQIERVSPGYYNNEIYKKASWSPRGDYQDRFGSSYADLTRGRIDEAGSSRNFANESNFWDQQLPSRVDKSLSYPESKGVHDRYAGSSATQQVGFGVKSIGDYDHATFEGDYARNRDAAAERYREIPRGSMFSNDRLNINKLDISPRRGNTDVDDIYAVAPQRNIKRRYVIHNDIDKTEQGGRALDDQPVNKRIHSVSTSDRIRHYKETKGGLQFKNVPFGRLKNGIISQKISSSTASAGSSRNKDYGIGMSLKRRLNPGPSEFHGSYKSNKLKTFRPKKNWKRYMEDGPAVASANEGNMPNSDPVVPKSDPPTGSELFTQQVHKAFLKYSRELNENPQLQKTYQEQCGGSAFRCFVCGSHSEKFVDTHSLVMHTYHSKKVGIRTEHLGLHKALCVLMGWNWTIAPENTEKIYQSTLAAEAKALKEDLILWPPVVILHNSTMTINYPKNERKVVTEKDVEEMLKDMKFETKKTQVSRRKPNNSVFLVKFPATLSGLQEAERLHKYFAEMSHGKEEFRQISSINSSTEVAGGSQAKDEHLLYGYLATADDLSKLDIDTKKRCLVKSKKEIEAIADAPLNID